MLTTNYWPRAFPYWPAGYWPDNPPHIPPAIGLMTATVTARQPGAGASARQPAAGLTARQPGAAVEVKP
jgi:hypothetical protein